MQLLVTHLTRMKPGFVCVAGMDMSTGEEVRPSLPAGQRLGRGLIAARGGPFGLGTVVDLGKTRCVGRQPHLEDHVFNPASAKVVGKLTGRKLWRLVNEAAKATLSDVFGEHLRQRGRGCAVDLGHGRCSLGYVVLQGGSDIWVNPWGSVKIRLQDGRFDVDLTLNDLRFWKSDQTTPKQSMMSKAQARVGKGVAAILGVGLGREWCKPGDSGKRHWAQANGLFFEDDPLLK